MDLDYVRSLDYYEVVMDDIAVVRELDTLLRRMFGRDALLLLTSKKDVKPKRYTGYFWATKEEFKVIKEHLDDLANQRLDEEYEQLLTDWK